MNPIRRWLRRIKEPVRPDDVDPMRWKAYLSFHYSGVHMVPRRGATPTHYYSCRWCDPSLAHWMGDRECEVIHVPEGTDLANWQAAYWSVQ